MKMNKKLVLIFAVLVLSTAFLVGCGKGKEIELDSGTDITDPSGATGEEESDQADDTGENADPGGEEERLKMFIGTLKAADEAAGKVTLENENDGELVLGVNEQSKILKGETEITLADLVNSIGSEVIAEYDDQSKVVTIICAQE